MLGTVQVVHVVDSVAAATTYAYHFDDGRLIFGNFKVYHTGYFVGLVNDFDFLFMNKWELLYFLVFYFFKEAHELTFQPVEQTLQVLVAFYLLGLREF